MLTVTTDTDLNRDERIRTPLRANYVGMKCLGLPRAAPEADFMVSEPISKTHRCPGVMLRINNMLGVEGAQHTACENQVGKNATAPATRFPAVPEFLYLHSKGGVWL